MKWLKNLFGTTSSEVISLNIEAPVAAQTPLVMEEDFPGGLTFDADSARVRTTRAADGITIKIKWLIDETVEINVPSSGSRVLITDPFISKNQAEIPAALDVAAFLEQPELLSPYHESDFEAELNESKDRRKTLAAYWTGLLMLHPSAEVSLAAIKTMTPATANTVTARTAMMAGLAMMLVCGNDQVRNEVAQLVWRCSEDSVHFLFNILGNRGVTPSGVLYDEGKRAALVLRAHCPAERKDYFAKKALELFGPSVAGEQTVQKKANVTFQHRYTKPVSPGGAMGNYEIYTAPNKREARLFLENYSITRDLFYVEVETPEGPLGKDKLGIY